MYHKFTGLPTGHDNDDDDDDGQGESEMPMDEKELEDVVSRPARPPDTMTSVPALYAPESS